MKYSLKELDIQIEYWQNIVNKYPKSESYKDMLYKLQQQRVDLVNQIGRKVDK